MRPAKTTAAKPRRRTQRAPAPKPYHHGDLRRVLIDAALQLVGEGGPDAVSVREAARRARGAAPRRGVRAGGTGGGRGARAAPPRRVVAGGAVPVFSEPRRPDECGGGG